VAPPAQTKVAAVRRAAPAASGLTPRPPAPIETATSGRTPNPVSLAHCRSPEPLASLRLDAAQVGQIDCSCDFGKAWRNNGTSPLATAATPRPDNAAARSSSAGADDAPAAAFARERGKRDSPGDARSDAGRGVKNEQDLQRRRSWPTRACRTTPRGRDPRRGDACRNPDRVQPSCLRSSHGQFEIDQRMAPDELAQRLRQPRGNEVFQGAAGWPRHCEPAASSPCR